MPTEPLPLALRIERAEAYVELSWERYLAVPDGRGFDSCREADEQRAILMDRINARLEQMLQMYDERTLEGVA